MRSAWIARLAGASLLAAAAGFAPGGVAAEEKPAIVWLDDFGAALKQAQREGRPILLEFYTSWCLYCGKLEKETFGDARVAALARELVCVRLDADVHKGVAARYEPPGFPTVILTTPTGEELFRFNGFKPADVVALFLKVAKEQGPRMTESFSVLAKSPKDLTAREALGTIYLELGLADQAVEHLAVAAKAAAARKDPPVAVDDRVRIEFLLGRAVGLAEDYPRAIKTFERLIQQYPSDARAAGFHLELVRALAASGKKSRADEIVGKMESQFRDTPQLTEARALLN